MRVRSVGTCASDVRNITSGSQTSASLVLSNAKRANRPRGAGSERRAGICQEHRMSTPNVESMTAPTRTYRHHGGALSRPVPRDRATLSVGAVPAYRRARRCCRPARTGWPRTCRTGPNPPATCEDPPGPDCHRSACDVPVPGGPVGGPSPLAETNVPRGTGSGCQPTVTSTKSETTTSPPMVSKSVSLAVVNETSTMCGIHASFGHVGVGSSGSGESDVTLKTY